MQQEEITLQTLTDNEDIQVGYSDNDIVIIDSIPLIPQRYFFDKPQTL